MRLHVVAAPQEIQIKLVKLWDVAAGAEMAKLEGHSAQVLGLAFNPDASQLVTAGADRQLKVWDLKTKENIASFARKPTAITAVTWNATGPAIFAATEGGAVMRYTDIKPHTGEQSSDAGNERQIARVEPALNCLTTTNDSERLFAGSADGRVFCWNREGKLLHAVDAAAPAVARTVEAAPAPTATPAPAPTPAVTAAPPVSFVRDVLPIIGKAGCNSGSCHAKPEGQNGFRLSVFSFDPRSDYQNIVEGARGRRIFPSDPGESLIVLKATHTIPHEGGERFDRDSEACRTLLAWIAGGMVFRNESDPVLTKIEVIPHDGRYRKGDSRQLTVNAHYADGSVRDVTALAQFSSNEKEIATVSDDGMLRIGQGLGQAVIVARFMGMVADSNVIVPAEQSLSEDIYAALPVSNFIDELAYARFRQLGLFPSDPCTDAEFLRRASLDALGLMPSADEARAFLDDPDPQKRSKVVDRLLEHPAYADHWAAKWADLLRPNPDRVGVKSVFVLDQWLRESFRQNKPYDQFVREIVLAQGNTHRDGPAVIYRDRREPADFTTMFSQIFLGVRLECARCHHHPNEKWSQEDFYQMAAFFAELDQKGGGISAPISGGNETFHFETGRSLKHPVTGEVMAPRPPNGPPAAIPQGTDPRRALADWMLDPANPWFSKAIANRIWSHFFGRGIVDPVDDFRVSNPPSHPALLDALARDLVEAGYDLKALMRAIMSSQLYQLSAEPNESNRADTRAFSRFYRRRLPAEMMADALADITGVPTRYPGLPPGSRAVQAWTYKIESRTMDAFGRPNSSTDCPCERNLKPAMSQALHLMNSDVLQEKLASTDATRHRPATGHQRRRPADIVDEIYLACYGRPPTADEACVALAAFGPEPADRGGPSRTCFGRL